MQNEISPEQQQPVQSSSMARQIMFRQSEPQQEQPVQSFAMARQLVQNESSTEQQQPTQPGTTTHGAGTRLATLHQTVQRNFFFTNFIYRLFYISLY